MKYLLDTCICIALIRQKSKSLQVKIESHQMGDLGISAITAAELRVGADKSADPAKNHFQLERMFLTLPILPFDEDAAWHYGKIRAELESIGQPIGSMDYLIAAHARATGLILVSTNLKEFLKVPALDVEAWT
jgi:tRNA(fMet)-specific endonuclease VapC